MSGVHLTVGRLPAIAAAGGAVAAVLASSDHGTNSLVAAVFAAALVSSVAGFAFSPVCAVLLLMLPRMDDPALLIALLLTASITIQSICLWRVRREIPWSAVLPFVSGGLLLLPVGLMLALHSPMERYKTILGLLLVAYAAWMLLKPRTGPPRVPKTWQEVAVGAAGGLSGGLAAFPGAPVVAWLGFTALPKARARPIGQAYILIMQITGLGLLYLLAPARLVAGPGAAGLLLVVPPAALGTLCGLAIYARLSDRQYGRVVNLLLLASGLAMVVLGR